MAKELMFSLSGVSYNAAPVKLERKKIYGWSAIVATNKKDEVCSLAYLSPDDALVIPAGGIKQAIMDNDGKWLDKSELKACDAEGNELPVYPSSFDAPIELSATATAEQFLDNDWEAVYQIANDELAKAVGDTIYKFEFNFRASTNHNDGYLLNTPGGLFLFAGDEQVFAPVALADQTTLDETETEVEEIDDLDFSMF